MSPVAAQQCARSEWPCSDRSWSESEFGRPAAARSKGEVRGVRSFVSSKCEVYAKECAVVAERQRGKRRRFEHGAQRCPVERAVAARDFVLRVANRSIAIDREGNRRGDAGNSLRPKPALSDERFHPIDVNRVGEVAFDAGHTRGTDRYVDAADDAGGLACGEWGVGSGRGSG